jgi:hypothetical protein
MGEKNVAFKRCPTSVREGTSVKPFAACISINIMEQREKRLKNQL